MSAETKLPGDVAPTASAYRKPRVTHRARLSDLTKSEGPQRAATAGDTLAGFGEIIADRARLDAYAEALRRVVTPDTIVADLGAGAGILSLLACQFGARRVYAFEASGTAELIREFARDNGFSDRLVVIEEPVVEATLPERAHVLVSDLRGVLLPFMRDLRDLEHARRHHLVDRGQIIPKRCVLSAALIHAPRAFEDRRRVWASAPHGLQIASALRVVDNSWHKHHASTKDLRSEPAPWTTIDCADTTGRAAGRVAWTIEDACQVHGALVWFDADLADGITLSNHPRSERTVHGQAFFPWPRAVDLGRGDRVELELRADPIGSDNAWSWNTEITSSSSRDLGSQFRQSDFAALADVNDFCRSRGRS